MQNAWVLFCRNQTLSDISIVRCGTSQFLNTVYPCKLPFTGPSKKKYRDEMSKSFLPICVEDGALIPMWNVDPPHPSQTRTPYLMPVSFYRWRIYPKTTLIWDPKVSSWNAIFQATLYIACQIHLHLHFDFLHFFFVFYTSLLTLFSQNLQNIFVK